MKQRYNYTFSTLCAGITMFSRVSFAGRTVIFKLRELSPSFKTSKNDSWNPERKTAILKTQPPTMKKLLEYFFLHEPRFTYEFYIIACS